nr:reverse transcriptase domain-containing protein [Tanacetum cinerariifolium]
MGLGVRSVGSVIEMDGKESDERVEESLTDQDLFEYTIKVPPPLVQKYKPPSQRDLVVHQRVPLILGRPFLRTARALIDVHGEEMILRDGDERLTLNMRHDASSYSNKPQKESINLINVFSDTKGGNVLLEKLLDLDSTKDPHLPHHFDIESDLKEIEYLLYHDPIKDIDSSIKDSIDQIESDTKNVYDDPFNSKGEKIKESKLLIDELDLLYDFLPSSEYDSFLSEDFSRVDALPSTNNEDKVFNPGIIIQENLFEVITHVALEKKDKKLAISHASLMIEDFDPPLYEPIFFKEVPRSKMLLLFSSENEEKVFELGIHTSEKVHSSLIPELSYQGYKNFKINQIFKSPMKIFLFSFGKDTHILVVHCFYFYPLDQFKYRGIRSS